MVAGDTAPLFFFGAETKKEDAKKKGLFSVGFSRFGILPENCLLVFHYYPFMYDIFLGKGDGRIYKVQFPILEGFNDPMSVSHRHFKDSAL